MRFLLSVFLAGTLSGCIVHGHGHFNPHGHGVVVDDHHVCSIHCDHYYYGGAWYVTSGHVHKHGCGHFFIGGRWVIRH